ncbi:hypothetical protein YB2330_002038 [Saitoella coloradoensis]
MPLYPRSSVKKIIKAHAGPKYSISKNVDVMMFLDHMLFQQALMKEASLIAREEGERMVRGRHVQKAMEKTLKQFKG